MQRVFCRIFAAIHTLYETNLINTTMIYRRGIHLEPHGMVERLMVLAIMFTMGFGSLSANILRTDDDDTNAPEDAWRYTVMLSAVDQLKLEMPCYDDTGYDSWIDKGYVYITIDGTGNKETLFYYESDDKDDDFPDVWGNKGVEGDMVLSRDQNYSSINVTNTKEKWSIPKVSGTNYSILRLTWSIPDKYRGKTVTISWGIHKTGNGPAGPAGESSKDIVINSSTIQIPAMPAPIYPSAQAPMLGYDAAHAGTMMLVYTMPCNTIDKLTAYYIEENGADQLNRMVNIDPNVSGNLYLPVDRCYRNFYIVANYKDSENKSRTTQSQPFDLAMLHNAAALSASLSSDGKVRLSWVVPDRHWHDLIESDFWEIQRCTSGVPTLNSQWSTIGQLTYDIGAKQYEFVDEDMISAFEGNPVYYRVRRTSTALWDWAPGTFAITQLTSIPALSSVQNATVGRSLWNDQQHAVNITFNMGSPGLTVKEDGLAYDERGHAVLRTAKDWNTFAAEVNSGQTTLGAIMAADINLGETLTMVGTTENPYSGIFDGNGHVLSFNPVPPTETDTVAFKEEYVAPFRYVGSATIRNLHVTGSISSSKKYIAGFVAKVNSKLTIDNCRSTVNLISSVKGEAHNGGFVAQSSSSTNVNISNSLFDGSFEGAECHSNGGFVGNGLSQVYISNCLFAPANLLTLKDNCDNFICTPYVGVSHVSHSYSLKSYKVGSGSDIIVSNSNTDSEGRFVINNIDDWNTFVKKVSNAGGAEVNAVLNTDLWINALQDRISSQYHGTFDGNGHTLHMNSQVLFPSAKDFTIKNLHVAGETLGGIHTAALVGHSESSSGKRNLIQNCRVSAMVSCKDGTHAGGFIGHSGSSNNTIENCLFDGQFEFWSSEGFGGGQYAGAFIGWGNSGTSNVVVNCLEKGSSYKGVAHAGLNYANGGNVYGGTNCWTYSNWGEANKVDTLKADELVAKLGFTNWSAASGQVLPIMHKLMLADASKTELLTALGSQWHLVSGNLTPHLYTQSSPTYATVLWDDRAKVVLGIEKFIGNSEANVPEGVFAIRSQADWNTFAKMVENAKGESDVNAILLDDISVTETVGTAEAPYRGTFDGYGHTLTLNIDATEDYIAPFRYVAHTTYIKQLNVKGEITGNGNTSGLVGYSTDDGTLTIENCRVSAHVYSNGGNVGGFIGHGNSATNIIRNCLFDGGLKNHYPLTYYFACAGAFIGAITVDGYYKLTEENNLERGEGYLNFNNVGANIHQIDKNTTETFAGTNTWTYTQDWSSVNRVPADMSAEQLVVKLDKTQWQVDEEGNVVPMQPESKETVLYNERRELTKEELAAGRFTQQLNTSCVNHRFSFTTEQSSSKLTPINSESVTPTRVEADKNFVYTFNNNVQLTSIKADTLQTAVTLTWEATGLGDYYRIVRYDKMTDKTDTLVAVYDQMSYMDRTPQPQHAYVYTIEGITQCEGTHVSSIDITAGCEPTGMVRGYLRLADGTAMAGVTVKAEPRSGNFVGAVTKTTKTDEAGFFEIGGLIYQNSATYEISVETTGEMQAMEVLSATFDDTKNLITDLRFTQSNYYRFSGQVAYEGTSVPVVGAQFERDGAIVKNGSGQPIITDSQGKFTLSVPQGTHTIRVVKDGHVFADDGFFLDADDAEPTKHNWQKEVADYIFWDQTRVTLRGRVVGGDDQGDLPLGQSLSRNNLGDSITIVMQLEGDNASYLIRDQLNANITELHHRFPVGLIDTCDIDVYRHRLVIHPDAQTGEYAVPMLPVKYKVTEVYAQGYATLFQSGEVGQTIDLTRFANNDTTTWNRIYHTPPTLAVRQYNMTGKTYFGINKYTDMDNTGKNYTIELWNETTGYSFGHPVFMAGSPVILMLAAEEQYYWNNDTKRYVPDVVHLPGGRVYIENGLIGTDKNDVIDLDDIGEAIYSFTPQNLTFTEEGDMALKTLTISLEYDSTFYDIKPLDGELLKGYVLASQPVAQGRRVVSDGGTCLIDILRDPPGVNSSAYIESGTKLNYSFTQSVTTQAGVKLELSNGGGSSWYNGVFSGVGGGSVVGQINNVSSTQIATLPIVATYYNNWQYNYTFETTERISTGTGQLAVGRDGDVFIGMTRNAVVEDAIAVRAITDETYQIIKNHEGGSFSLNGVNYKVRQGTMKVLAQGQNSKGEKVWIVRDEVLQVSSHINSTFVHSQVHIEQELIPELINVRNSLLLTPETSEETAQAIANQRGFPAFISKVPADDVNFASEGYYTQVNPTTEGGLTNDSIQALNRNILTWIGFLAVNEREKVEASDLVKTYDVDGRASVSYNEAFTLSKSESRYFLFPLIQGTGGFSTGGFGVRSPDVGHSNKSTNDNEQHIEIETFGNKIAIKLSVVASLDYNYNYGMNETQIKKVGFTLAPSTKSNLVVNVYRTQTNSQILDDRRAALLDAGHDEEDVDQMLFMYASEDFIKNIRLGGNGVPGNLGGMCSYMTSAPQMYRSLVYRTQGGATSAPYEDERRTKYYNPGTLLDAKTIEIDRLRIWADEQTVSNVPYDEPARFTIHMANESEAPALATPVFYFFIDDSSNAKGAKVQVEGVPLSGSGSSVVIPVGTVVTKQVEIYPGAEFDYENIGISLYDPNDKARVQKVNLTAHFVPTAGKVNISLPGDKWVVNTESQFDDRLQQYYMPVVIDGFDVNYRGFDHIELQYKLATQGDKEWVNVCSFYKDPLLMAKASGVCELIKEDGRIVANFYGEVDPIEQEYNLRAVSYCRHGGGFLTRSSAILTGIKDTRRPGLFGTPKPEDGILDIGEDIMLRFSEPIAGNYLRELNNFQVLGQTNSSNITLSTDLRFNGYGLASSQATRNLMGKSFTVDVMLYPDKIEEGMSFFSHGENGSYLELGLTADHRLTAAFGQSDTTGLQTKVYTSTEPVAFNGLHQVLYTFENDLVNQTTTVRFYDGTKQIGSFVHPAAYDGYGNINLGQGAGLIKENVFYSGEMLEFRLWNRVLSTSEMSDYSLKILTGYELGLLDNFPLNEGRGEYSYNRVASGSDLALYETSWKVPDGIGMILDGQEGFRLKPDKFQRWDHQDYTLMFWFQTGDDSGTLLANGRAEDEAEASEHFRFSVCDGSLELHLGGLTVPTTKYVSDGQWHHVALTMNRSRNLGCLYLDKQLCQTFAVDTLGGINGNNLAAGAIYDGTGISQPIHGRIDEIAMFEMALPENSLKNFATTTATGDLMGLMAYLSFSQNELQMNGQQRLMPTGVSLKRYRDMATGLLTAQRDTIVAQDVVDRLADRTIYAPMRDVQTLENIKYSFVADGKDLLINLDVPDERIEKTNVFILVRDVADLQGNLMASPVALELYVYRNPLRWNVKRLSLTPNYGEEYTFEATIQNLSGKTHQYTLEGLPIWITASQTSGRIGPLDEETITFTISPYINIGDFDEVFNLIGEEGMNEPLPVSIRVRGDAPEWSVDQALLRANITMNVMARVIIEGRMMNDPEDRLAVFGEGHRTLGVAKLNASDGIAYLTIYNSSSAATPLRYEFYDASTGIVHVLLSAEGDEVGTFKSSAVVGSPDNPYIFETNNHVVQTLHLQEGWNWISFNVHPEVLPVGELLNSATKWEVGDGLEIIRPNGTYAQISYKQFYNPDDPRNPILAWDEAETLVELDPQQMYRFYSQSQKTGYISGYSAYESITVKPGWNRIGYLSRLNLPVGTALADYTDVATVGDIIKSQTEFAVLAIDANGNRAWRGTLQYMKAGEGYMLMRKADSNATFNYPLYYGKTRYNGSTSMLPAAFHNTSGTSMTVVATATGIDTEEGDVLTAYRGAEVCGVAIADADGLFFLNVGDVDAASDALSFTLEREEEIIGQAAGRQMFYAPNAAHGTPELPTAINFVESREVYGEGWYTVGGIRLTKRPTEVGVYIYNNEKVMIK